LATRQRQSAATAYPTGHNPSTLDRQAYKP
jgi:hypothetical protein